MELQQQQQQQFQSTNDSFSVQVPFGWVIHDVNNTGSESLEEASKGYGILAQLCTEEEQQQLQGTVPSTNASDGSTNNSTTNNCQRAQEELVHVIRYPDLNTRVLAANNATTANNNNVTIDNVLTYHLQKLQEVGYGSIQLVNSTDMRVNLTNPLTNQTIATVPAKLVEMTYSTGIASNEIRRSYFILTATDATLPNLGTIKGYAVFYEGNTTVTATPAITTTTTVASGSLAPTALPPAVGHVFDSFELIVAPEIAQALAQRATTQAAELGEGEGEDTSCDSSYPDNCISSPPPDLDCGDPGVPQNFRVLSPDPHDFDRDNDGIGCEDGSNAPDDSGVGGGDLDDGDDNGDTSCHPSYPDDCIPPPPPNLNCGDEGVPENFQVVGSDPHGFDGDNDGIGCETDSDPRSRPRSRP